MKSLCIVLLGMFMSINAGADYLKGAIGYTLGGEVKVDGPAGSSTADLDQEFLFPIVAAYGFQMSDNFNIEGEFSFRKNDYENSTADSSVIAGAVNAVGSAPVGVVNISGGIGVTLGSYDLGSSADKGTAVGMQVFGGVDFPVQDNLTLGGEFRYFASLTDIDIGNGADADYKNTSLLFVAKFGL